LGSDMPKSVKPLSDVEIKRAKAREKQYKLYDGNGLFLLIRANGKKVFKFHYKFRGKDTEKTLGEYPILSLGGARKRVSDNAVLTFDDVADKYFSFKEKELSYDYLKKQKSRYKYFVNSAFGSANIEEISKKDIISAINNVPNANTRSTKQTDVRETMRIVLLLINSIFKYALSNDLTKNTAYITIDASGLIPKRENTHCKAITNEDEFRSLYMLLNDYIGDVSTKYALLFIAHTALRSQNVRFLKWENIDFKKKIIEFSKEEMKAREPFRIPLTDKTIEILKEVEQYNRGHKYVFSSVLSKGKMLSENTLGYALKTQASLRM